MLDPSCAALRTVEDFLEVAFDYLVMGGGTAGLVIAARLSEDPKVTVGELEAGHRISMIRRLRLPRDIPNS